MQALKGLKVLDISRVLAAPNCTQIFADFGAEVWKVEAPWGDESRGWGSSGFAMVNRGKKSVVINLAEPRGQALIRKLAEKADVAIENFKVGNLKRFNIDLPSLMALNDRLIGCSVTGFGQTGPYSAGLGYDMVLQAMTGLMSVTGDPDRPPARVGVALYDIMLGLNAAVAILVALQARAISGKGQYIDVSLYDVGMASFLGVANNYLNDGTIPARQGSKHPNFAPVEPVQAADGAILICVGTDVQFRRLCVATGLPHLASDERFSTNDKRVENRAALIAALEDKLKTATRAEWQSKLLEQEVPAGPIYDVIEALNDPHARARNVISTIGGSAGGEIQVLSNPIQHMSLTPPSSSLTPPRLGQHTAEILSDVIGLSADEIRTLAADDVIRLEAQA